MGATIIQNEASYSTMNGCDMQSTYVPVQLHLSKDVDEYITLKKIYTYIYICVVDCLTFTSDVGILCMVTCVEANTV